MAYTLSDPFRSLRIVLRLCGAVMALLGLALLLAPMGALANWFTLAASPLWPLRLAGGGLLTLGIYYLLASSERILGLPVLVTCALGNGLAAIILVTAYLQQDLAGLTWLGQLLLILVFMIYLVGAVTPLRYLRAEYRIE